MGLVDDYFALMEKRKKKKQAGKSSESATDDIAPIKYDISTSSTKVSTAATNDQEEDNDSLQLVQSPGAFDDGYQAGDIAKTILGTVGDVGVNIVKGAQRMVEGVVDLGAYGVAGVANAIGKVDFATRLKKATAESQTDAMWGGVDDYLDEYSVLGRTSDSITEGIGQVGLVLATGGIAGGAGLGSAGVTAVTTGVTGLGGMGSGMSEAYQNGATDEEATLYGAIAGTAEVATELLFGGLGKAVGAVGLSKGLLSADDLLAKKVSAMFTSQIGKNIAEYGIKASAEGLEEVLSGIAQAVGKKVTYMSDRELGDILADENLLEQFVVGTVTSGIAQSGVVPGMKGGSLIEANQTGRDFITGYTQDEQTVIDKVVEQEIAEAEKDGKKLTKKEKGDIQKQVENKLDKGYISIDTIEETLGGDTYKAYQDAVDSEDALQNEFDILNKMRQGEMTGEQIDRRTELKQQLEDLKTKSQREQLKTQLNDEVFSLVKDTRLAESYNERTRRGQVYEADLSQYDAKQQAVVQKAIDSGILNNTNRTHEFVDMIAKISADKGVPFDFTNNERLKESGFAVDGATVNGYVTKDGVTLNIQSSKTLNSVAGHEITHVLEGTELYAELQNSIFEYAKTKGDYDSRLAAITKLYEGVDGADVNAELTADLVGDYLFKDADFVRKLSTEHRNVFQKIYDEIKYLCKVATAGSKEARELEKVKKVFEDAYRAETKSTVTEDGVKYSLSTVSKSRNGIDIYTEGQYNSFGWASYNNVITAREREILFSRYADFKHNRNKYPVTKWGEAVIHSTECPDVIMYVNGTIDLPTVTRIIRIKTDDSADLYIIQERIVANEFEQKPFPYDAITNCYGEEYLEFYRKRDYASFRQYQDAIKEGRSGQTSHSGGEIVQDGTGSGRGGVTSNRADEAVSDSAETNEITSSEASSSDGVFFDASTHYSLSVEDDIAPIYGNYNVYGKDIALENGQDDIAPVMVNSAQKDIAQTRETPSNDGAFFDTANDPVREAPVAKVLTEEPKVDEKQRSGWSMFKNNVLDKGMVFEDLSLATGNRELQARWNSIRYADSKAQRLIGVGNAHVKSLNSIREDIEKTGKTQQFYEYMYHNLNVDRMTLADRYGDVPNKPVFGDRVTARESEAVIAELERKNPSFRQSANDVYDYVAYLREQLVDGGVISSETARLWKEMYPHYVPIHRKGDTGLNINVPLDTGRTGVNAPIKTATGGSRDIAPLFNTLAQRTEQTFKAVAKNRFGVELKNTLNSTVESDAVGVDEAIDSLDTQDGLLQEGKNGHKPTFTVFENGEKVTFEITDEMYDAMKPSSEAMAYTSKALNAISNFRRGTLTEYNPWFMLKNAVKDVQDVLINSQHAAQTYAAIPKAINQMATNGRWYQEYLDNGGEQNTYFAKQDNTFAKENKALEAVKKVTGLNAISKANDIIERLPRLAEYIASREAGRSIDVSMLDAARVTTNFAAGGDLAKFANRNGATFLNASIQGAVQQVRNIREAKANGLRGWAKLAGTYVLAGLPAVLLNNLIWDDDEEYEELSDYVKQNYYIVGKFGDGQFVRIPKGRTVAVIQNAFEQMGNAITGDDEVDLKSFVDLVVNNLAPNNPVDNNIFSPIIQVANNETWYGEDLVPTRLQDLPAEEQYDESTDAISRWLGETFDYSPYKINYLLDQYSGVVGDTFLPMLTPEAESGDNTFAGNMIAPLKDMFTTDSVMNNQNVSDFYDAVDELTTNAKGSKATDEDVLKYKYMNSVNAALGELYGQKREIQNSDLPDDEKYEAVREIQRRIDEMAEEALNSYDSVSITGNYATVGDRHYRWYEPGEDSNAEAGWQKLTDKQLVKQTDVTASLGITPEEYWGNKEEYDYAYENPARYTVAKAVGGYSAYRGYSSALNDIYSDKDENGKSISGSRKEKVADYVFNELDLDYGAKCILFKNEYNADDTYNYDIVSYLDSRDDISWKEMKAILEELNFTVYDDGKIEW